MEVPIAAMKESCVLQPTQIGPLSVAMRFIQNTWMLLWVIEVELKLIAIPYCNYAFSFEFTLN